VALPPKPSTKWEQFEAVTSGIAKMHSSSENSQQAYGREAINKGLKKAQEGAQQAESVASTASDKILSSPFGYVFGHSLPRRAKLVVLGAPYSHLSLVCNAITALSNLAAFSITEDQIGRFHNVVPSIIRAFTTAIKKIDAVRECLQQGLQNILAGFEKYLGGMGMSLLEISDAKKAAASLRQPEMLQTSAAR
jgi:nucleoporin NDC1